MAILQHNNEPVDQTVLGRWLKTATMTLHEPVEEIVVPFCLELEVPEFSPAP